MRTPSTLVSASGIDIQVTVRSAVSVPGGSAGGLVGLAQDSVLSSLTASGSIAVITTQAGAAVRGVGGLVGFLDEASLGDAISDVHVDAENQDRVGGLAGEMFRGDIARSSATGAVHGNEYVGGLVGYSDQSVIDYSFASGDVTGTERVGGLAGYLEEDDVVENAYATGSVEGARYVGGLVGEVEESTIRYSYASGSVVGTGEVGGLVGEVDEDLDVVASFASVGPLVFSADRADIEDSRVLEAEEFTTLSTFADVDWDIVDGWAAFDPGVGQAWGICPAVNAGRPFLLWQFTADPCTATPPTTTTTAATPVLIGGVAPTLPAGQGVWQQSDGTTTPLTLTAPAGNQLRYAAEGVTVTLTGTDATDPSRGLVADPAGEIVCEVCVAAAAGQVIEVWLFSDPRLVAALRTDSTADTECHLVSIPLSAPLDGQGPITAGAHTLQLAIPTATGMQAISVGVTVGGPVPASVPAGEGSTAPLGLLALTLLALTALAGTASTRRRTTQH